MFKVFALPRLLLVFATLSLGTASCAGGPPSQQGSDTMNVTPATVDAGSSAPGSASAGSSAPPSSAPPYCLQVEQGCPCNHWGDVVDCKGPLIRDGAFVTCAGLRACVQGMWGPCMPQAVTDPGLSGKFR